MSQLEVLRKETYRSSNGTLMGRLSLHVEGNAIGGLGLDLEAGCYAIELWSALKANNREQQQRSNDDYNPNISSITYLGWCGRNPCSGAAENAISLCSLLIVL